MIKKLIIILCLLPIVFLLYFFGGVVISYRRQPEVSEEYKAAFHAGDCYSEHVSCERAYIIEDNEEALIERLRMIEQATERIILSTFEFRSDESGKDVLAMLLAAAQRGVDVRIIADGAVAEVNMIKNAYFHALAAMENVEIRLYNCLNFLMPWKSMGRLHDKYLIVDDDLYLLGGRNTYDFFLGESDYKDYDRDVLVYSTDPTDEERSIHQLERYFESVWALEDCETLRPRNNQETASAHRELEERCEKLRRAYPDLAQKADYAGMTYEVNKITLLANPTHVYAKEPTLFYALTELMKQSTGDISIHTPYIICNEWMYDSLREICERSHTKLLTNSAANSGNPFGASDYLRNKERLLDTGLDIYEYEGGTSYHGKSIAIGDRLSVVGSFNMDMRSVYLDTELMLVIDSEGLNGQLREIMRSYEASSVRALKGGQYENPGNVKRQEFSKDRKRNVDLLKYFNWLRFLM